MRSGSGRGIFKGGRNNADLHDNRNGPIGKGNLPMLVGGIVTVMSLTRNPGMGSSAQVCIRQVYEQLIYSNGRQARMCGS